MPISTPEIDSSKSSTTRLTGIILIASLFALAACSASRKSPVRPTQIPFAATLVLTATQLQIVSISPTAPHNSGLLEPNNQGNDTLKGTDDASCSPGTNIVQGTIIVPITRSNMAGTQYHFILPDGTLIDASEIPDGMCATATGALDECSGLAVGAVGLDFDDTGLPLVECPHLKTTH